MAATIKGKGAKFGIGVFTLTPLGGTVVVNTTKAALQSRRHSKDAEFTELRDEDNDVAGGAFSNPTTELSFTCIFVDSTNIANAIANRDALFTEAIGVGVTIADTDGTILDTTFVLMSVTANQGNGAFETVDVTLKKFANDISATMP